MKFIKLQRVKILTQKLKEKNNGKLVAICIGLGLCPVREKGLFIYLYLSTVSDFWVVST